MKKLFALMMLLLCIMTRLSADEVALTISKKLSQTTGEASTTVGDITFKFTGSGTSYQDAYVKMTTGSGLIVSSQSGNITKIVIGFAAGRTKTMTFSTNPGTWAEENATWTGSSPSVTFSANESKGESSINTISVTYTPSSSLTFANSQDTGDLLTLGMYAQNPTGVSGNVTYKSLNEDIVKVDGNWLRFVNTGLATIQATDGNNVTGYYTLLVNAQDAQFPMTDKTTCTATATGKINGKLIQDVPFIKMQIGANNETAMIRSLGDAGYMAVTSLDANGFIHAFVDQTGLPTMGTYYRFTPTVSGTLTVKGAFDPNGNGSKAAQLYLGKDEVQGATIAFKPNFEEQTGSFNLEAGKTYYLYVSTADNKNYDIFCLHSFSFQPDFYFKDGKYVASTDNNSYTQEVIGDDGNTSYTVKASGDLTAKVDEKSGKVTWSGDGGAILVTAYRSSDGSSDSYVITVPYKSHEWNFRSLDKLKENTTDWAVTYKVRQYDNKELTYINAPVMSNGSAIDGTNALYIPSTAGLLLNTGANGMGSDILKWTNGDDFDGLSLDQQLAQTYDKVSDVSLLSIKNSTLTIPNLKKGQYIRIKWCRYTVNHGDHIQATNVTDLNGKEITGKFNVGVPSRHNKENGNYGYEFFIVKEDGDVTFTQKDDGWTDIFDIKVANKEKMVDTDGNPLTGITDMRLVEERKDNVAPKYSNPLIYTGSTTITFSQNTGDLHVMSCMADGDGGTKGTVKYTFVRKEGNVEANMTENGVLTITGGQGILTIKQEGINQDYTLDRNVTDVTVYEKKTVKKTYPFTWDFANNKTTADAFTGDEWTKNSDGTFTLNAKSWNYFQGNDLQKAENGSDILETQDLGIDVPHDKDNSLTVELGKGLKFGANDYQVLTIPQVPAKYKAYILATVDNGGSIAKDDGTTLSGETYKADESKKIFVIDGNGKDINLTVKNALIEKIGVTGTFKKFNVYNGKSYATEYRDHNEKYDLTGIFTNGKKVEANFIQEVDNNAHLAKTSSISIAPKETGVILTCSATDGVNAIPLFVKDVNSEESTIESNMLKGTLEETNQLESNGVNYVFTRVSYDLDKDGKIVDSNNGKQSTLGFYRVAANDDSSLDANKAYLHISASNPAKTFYVIEGLFDTNTTTAISNISTADHSAGEEGSYYTLTGIRLNGRPTHAGIYVLNGKKVIIK
jgi:hypothetical protein